MTMTEPNNVYARGLLLLLGIGILILASSDTAYPGEWEPKIPEVVNRTLEIEIINKEFTNPETGKVGGHLLVVPEGMSIRWTNKDPLITVNGPEGLMPHGIQISDETDEVFTASEILTRNKNVFVYAFNASGSYNYSCFIHPFMRGRIVVVDLGQ